MNEKDMFDFDYSLYLEHLAVCQNNTVRCVAEAVCISEGQIDTLVSVNEAFIDTVKNIINRIIEAVKKQFAKFTETMKGIFTPDSKWLKDQKVKSIILNQPWKERDPFEMTQYHEENLNKYTIKQFDFNNFKQVTTAENPEVEFMRTYFGGALDISKLDGEDIRTKIKGTIMGDMKEVRISSLPKKEMYEFCVTWEDTLKKLNNDVTRLDACREAAARALGAYARDIESQLNDTTNKTQEAQEESSVYSLLYNTFITEGIEGLKNKPIEPEKPAASTNTGNASNGKIQTGANNIDGEQIKSGVDSYKGGENDAKLKEVKTMQDNTSQYFTFMSNIIMGKISAAQSMYKDYMKLLRLHVKDYAGEKLANASMAPATNNSENQEQQNANNDQTKEKDKK